MGRKQRLDKILANLGYGTRKEVKALIKSGMVDIDGVIAKNPGEQIDTENQEVKIGGNKINYRDFIYIMLNKPKGVVSATEDTREQTVIDLLTDEYKVFKPFPVGRLDKDTEGLLLLTNNGQLAHSLLSPKKHVPKTYLAEVRGRVGENDIKAFERGVKLDDGYITMPSKLELLERGEISTVKVTIHEGKFHQVKRMFKSVNKEVIYLKRLSMGSLVLDESLETGEFRELTPEEIGSVSSRN
jgi:16S rRNA pseudouridine516 synthase